MRTLPTRGAVILWTLEIWTSDIITVCAAVPAVPGWVRPGAATAPVQLTVLLLSALGSTSSCWPYRPAEATSRSNHPYIWATPSKYLQSRNTPQRHLWATQQNTFIYHAWTTDDHTDTMGLADRGCYSFRLTHNMDMWHMSPRCGTPNKRKAQENKTTYSWYIERVRGRLNVPKHIAFSLVQIILHYLDLFNIFFMIVNIFFYCLMPISILAGRIFRWMR